MLKNVASEIDKNAVDKELQNTDDSIFFVVPFNFWLVFSKKGNSWPKAINL